jgi:hypothetical protein
MAKHSSHILDLARKGAEHRYQELKAEIAGLVKNFPHLGRGATSKASDGKDGKATGVRRRRKMSAKARAAISAAQKARWAKQKATAKKG